MQTINDTKSQQIKSFFEDTIKNFETQATILKSELLQDLPAYLQKPGTTKITKNIDKWEDDVTEEQFVKLLRTQTEGYEFHTFEYFIAKYNLQFDSNNMIIFIDEFPFDNRIKKEALFIWGIFNHIKNHPLLKQFLHLLQYSLQTRIGLIGDDISMQKQFDLSFPELKIIVEIDENHGDLQKKNDDLKTAIVRQNGSKLLRLNFQETYPHGEIEDDENANESMLNSESYKKFLDELCSSLLGSLLKNNENVRTKYIVNLFINALNAKIAKSRIDIANNKQLASDLLNKLRTARSMDEYTAYYEKHKIVLASIEYNDKAIKHNRDIRDNLSKSDNFANLFKLKDAYKNNNYSPNITLGDVVKITQSTKYDTKIKMCEFGFIADILIADDKILITWSQLALLIMYNSKNTDLRDVLYTYYVEVENFYEVIISKINEFTDSIIGDPKSYNLCARYIEKKYKNKYEAQNLGLRATISKLKSDPKTIPYKEALESIKTLHLRNIKLENNNWYIENGVIPPQYEKIENLTKPIAIVENVIAPIDFEIEEDINNILQELGDVPPFNNNQVNSDSDQSDNNSDTSISEDSDTSDIPSDSDSEDED